MRRLPPTRLLATDLDHTLVGDAAGSAAFSRWFAVRRHQWRLAYLTGRSLASAWDLIAAEGLLLPDALVTDVGTVIHVARHHPPVGYMDYRLDGEWQEGLVAAWPGAAVCEALAGLPGLELQPGGRRPLRLGYQVSSPRAVEAAAQRLAARGLPVRLVYSSGCDLDVLPSMAGKGAALHRLVERWGLRPEEVLACGDSGNDLDMLTAGYPAVLVANATAELRHAPLPEGVYRAGRPYAWGILEALGAGCA